MKQKRNYDSTEFVELKQIDDLDDWSSDLHQFISARIPYLKDEDIKSIKEDMSKLKFIGWKEFKERYQNENFYFYQYFFSSRKEKDTHEIASNKLNFSKCVFRVGKNNYFYEVNYVYDSIKFGDDEDGDFARRGILIGDVNIYDKYKTALLLYGEETLIILDRENEVSSKDFYEGYVNGK